MPGDEHTEDHGDAQQLDVSDAVAKPHERQHHRQDLARHHHPVEHDRAEPLDGAVDEDLADGARERERQQLGDGLGVGPRENDFDATGNDWTSRGRRFEEQVALMRRIWRGEAARPGCDPIGPTPVQAGGPKIIIGGFVDVALERAGRLADGLRTFDFAPEVTIHHQRIAVVQRAWEAAGRAGKPWIIVRNSKKDYGTSKMIEGTLKAGDVVLLVEDIATTGGQVLEAAKIITEGGGKVDKIGAETDCFLATISSLQPHSGQEVKGSWG